MISQDTTWSGAVVACLVAGSVTSLGLGLLAALAGPMLARSRPRQRHHLWTGMLVATLAATLAPLARTAIVIPVDTGWIGGFPRNAAATPTLSALGRSLVPSANQDAPMALARGGVAQIRIADIVVAFWLVGMALLLLRSLRAMTIVTAIRRRARSFPGTEWQQSFAAGCARGGVRPRVELLESVEVDIPFVTGLVRPALVLPVAAHEWSAAEQASVTAHEVAHLVRRDLHVQMLAALLRAVHWFNPVVLRLIRQSALDAELAADEMALDAGILPSRYAETLVSLSAASAWGMPSQTVLAFAQPHSLAIRVSAVLAPRSDHAGKAAGLVRAVLFASCLAAVGGGCVRLTPRTNPKAVVAPAHQPDVAAPHADGSQPPAGSPGTIPSPRTTASPAADRREAADWTRDAELGLIRALGDVSPHVRMAAAGSLGRFPSTAVRASLALAAATDSDVKVRNEARRVLSAMEEQP